jgi:hypothetical protein
VAFKVVVVVVTTNNSGHIHNSRSWKHNMAHIAVNQILIGERL